MVCGLPLTLSVRVIEPLRLPVAMGVKVTLMVQPPPALTELPHVFVWAKSPLTPMARYSVTPPVLVRVMVCEPLAVPRTCGLKESAVGLRETCVSGAMVTAKGKDAPPPGEGLMTVTCAVPAVAISAREI
jgi:hypothetical protein